MENFGSYLYSCLSALVEINNKSKIAYRSCLFLAEAESKAWSKLTRNKILSFTI